jgi:hypothetical protein
VQSLDLNINSHFLKDYIICLSLADLINLGFLMVDDGIVMLIEPVDETLARFLRLVRGLSFELWKLELRLFALDPPELFFRIDIVFCTDRGRLIITLGDSSDLCVLSFDLLGVVFSLFFLIFVTLVSICFSLIFSRFS